MGEVWRGRHREQGLPVAVKVVHARLWSREESRVAFRDEVRAVARLDHPGVVAVFDHGEVPPEAEAASGGEIVAGSPYLVMELAEGGSLDAALAPAAWAELRALLLAVLDALGHAHARGVVHRDLKPGNVLIDGGRGEDSRWKLTDFGIAQALDADFHHPRPIAGTPAYMAPEQFLGRWRDIGPATDLYALGCMAWELCTGQPPFAGSPSLPTAHLHRPPPAFVPRLPVPEGTEAWLRVLLAKDPGRRYAVAADAAWALRELGEPATDAVVRAAPVHLAVTNPTLTLASLGSAPPGEITQALPLVSRTPDEAQGPTPTAIPPFPLRGRRDASPPPPPLVDAGLSLFALRTLPIVGRETEQDALWEWLGVVVREGTPGAVVLRGEPGVGKTRLGAWLTERAAEVGAATVLRVNHAAVPGPGDGLPAMVERVLGAAGLDREGVEERIERHLARLGPGDPVDVAAMVDLVRPRVGGVERGGASRRERLQVLARWVARLAVNRPVLLWIEDAQHAADALDLALTLLDGARPVLVLVAAREGPGEPRPAALGPLCAHPRTRTLDLGPLPEEALVRLVAGPLRMDPALAARVARQAAGLPMYAVQLVREWIHAGQLVAGAQGFRLRDGAAVELPADLHAVWSAYLDRLVGGRARIAVEVAAVLGQQVNRVEWARATVLAGGDLDAVRETLVRHGLAVPDPGGFRFAHALFRESVLRSAREAGRLEALHQAAATALAEVAPRAEGRRGVHLDEAGRADEAVPLLILGARRALSEDDHPSAAELLDRAGRALDRAGAAAVDERRAEVDLVRAKLWQREPPLDRAQALALDVEQRALNHGWDRLAAEAAFRVGEVARLRGDLPVADAAVDRALARAETLGDADLLARSLRGRANVAVMSGDVARARGAVAAALEASEAVGDRFGVATCWMLAAELDRSAGRWDEAEAAFTRALELYLDMRSRTGEVVVRLGLAEVARFRGQLDRAEAMYRGAIALNQALGRDGTIVSLNLSLCLLARERYDEAQALLEEVCASWERKARPGYLACALVALLVPLAWRADWTRWDEVAGRAETLLARTRMVDLDVAIQAERAAALARAAGEEARASRAAAVAADQRGRLAAGGR